MTAARDAPSARPAALYSLGPASPHETGAHHVIDATATLCAPALRRAPAL